MKKRIVRIYNIIILVLFALGLIYVCNKFVHLGTVEYTNNAMVHRNMIPVNTRVQGFIKEIRFREFSHVSKGDALVIIEDAEYRLALAQAEANVSGTISGSGAVSASINTVRSNVSVQEEALRAAKASAEEARVAMEDCRRDYRRFEALLDKDAVTQQQFDHAKARYEQATSRYNAAVARVTQAEAARKATSVVGNEQKERLGQSMAGQDVARAQLNLAKLNLSYTVITAPCDGYMGRKEIHTGQLVQPGQKLACVVDDKDIWVTANYRESQMPNIKEGMEATFEADAIPGVTFRGKVKSISHASGAAYSGMPVDNSTGNFVKVEQRVPVRIELTADNKKEDISLLYDGLNVECEVDY